MIKPRSLHEAVDQHLWVFPTRVFNAFNEKFVGSCFMEVLMILLLPLTLLYTCWSTVGGIHWNCWLRDRSGMVAGGFTAGVVPVLQVLLQVLLRLLQTTEVRHSPLRFLLLATSHPCSSPLAHRLVCVWIPLLLLNLPASWIYYFFPW